MDNGFHTIFEIGKHAEIINDGMDIAICTYDNRALTLTFSSAKRPLYIIRGNILTEIKGSSSPIGGGYYFKYPYTNKNLKLEEKDRYFMFTDGFADQFGGDKLKKLKTAGFKDLLIKFSEQKMSAYKEALNNYFEEWKRTEEQTDDVLVLGFEINKTHY